MVRVSINDKEYQIKNSWEEVDAEAILKCKDFRDELKVLTDIPHEIIDKGTREQLFPIYTACSFIDDLNLIPIIEACDVEQESYDKLERAKRHFKEGKPYKKIISAGMVYYPEEKNTVRLIGLGASLVSQISIFLENYREMFEAKPDSQEEAAGIEEVNAFGAWGTAFVLAGRDILKHEAILKMKAIDVYTALFYSFRESRYMKQLHDIKYRKK